MFSHRTFQTIEVDKLFVHDDVALVVNQKTAANNKFTYKKRILKSPAIMMLCRISQTVLAVITFLYLSFITILVITASN